MIKKNSQKPVYSESDVHHMHTGAKVTTDRIKEKSVRLEVRLLVPAKLVELEKGIWQVKNHGS